MFCCGCVVQQQPRIVKLLSDIFKKKCPRFFPTAKTDMNPHHNGVTQFADHSKKKALNTNNNNNDKASSRNQSKKEVTDDSRMMMIMMTSTSETREKFKKNPNNGVTNTDAAEQVGNRWSRKHTWEAEVHGKWSVIEQQQAEQPAINPTNHIDTENGVTGRNAVNDKQGGNRRQRE
jgi:hypothetical protein